VRRDTAPRGVHVPCLMHTRVTRVKLPRVAVVISGHLRGHPHTSCQKDQLGLVPFWVGLRGQLQGKVQFEFFVHVWDTMETPLPLYRDHTGDARTQAYVRVTLEQAAEWFAPLDPCWMEVATQSPQQLTGLVRLHDMQRPHLLGVKYQYAGMHRGLNAAAAHAKLFTAFDYVYRVRADHCHRFQGKDGEIENQPPRDVLQCVQFLEAMQPETHKPMLLWTTGGGSSCHDVLILAPFESYTRVMQRVAAVVDGYFGRKGTHRHSLPHSHEALWGIAAKDVGVTTYHFRQALSLISLPLSLLEVGSGQGEGYL
jgi:hypothetical protein